MSKNNITKAHINHFEQYLIQTEKSTATVEKYLRDVRAFAVYVQDREVTKDIVIAYKKFLQKEQYAVRSINSMLASLNSFLQFLGWSEYKVKSIKQQKQVYCSEAKELTKAEYYRLLHAASNDKKLQLVMQSICSTGIRVSELQFFTVEHVKRGEIIIDCKGKNRTILIPSKLKKLLLDYAKKQKICSGAIFLGRDGKKLDRKKIWYEMKKICKKAKVSAQKVFPHNLRKLFARTFYGIEKDIAKLADILGHSSIDTTRIYIMTTGIEHRRKIERLNLVLEKSQR